MGFQCFGGGAPGGNAVPNGGGGVSAGRFMDLGTPFLGLPLMLNFFTNGN